MPIYNHSELFVVCVSLLVTFPCLGPDSSKISVSGLQIWPDQQPKYRYRFVRLQSDEKLAQGE